jgi:hypothetical protein
LLRRNFEPSMASPVGELVPEYFGSLGPIEGLYELELNLCLPSL